MLQAAANDCLCCRCVLELHAIASKKEEGRGRFAVAMTAQENERFLKGIEKDHDEYYGMLGRVRPGEHPRRHPAQRWVCEAEPHGFWNYGRVD